MSETDRLINEQAQALADEMMRDKAAIFEAKYELLQNDYDRIRIIVDQYKEAFKLIEADGLSITQSGSDRLEASERFVDLLQKGKHLELLQTAIEENETVTSAWQRFMFTLRVCGYDENS